MIYRCAGQSRSLIDTPIQKDGVARVARSFAGRVAGRWVGVTRGLADEARILSASTYFTLTPVNTRRQHPGSSVVGARVGSARLCEDLFAPRVARHQGASWIRKRHIRSVDWSWSPAAAQGSAWRA